MQKINIAIFASGSGTNARAIIEHLRLSEKAEVALIITNKANAGVIEVAQVNNIPFLIIKREEMENKNYLLPILKSKNIEFIVLAGFLLKIPDYLVHHFEKRMLNIHPALLPKFGGKGMYGKFVHAAVIASKEKKSGISIHYVSEGYDEGNIIFQKEIELSPDETAESLEQKIHLLEHAFFPKVITETVEKL
jgi:phosphoribosylglycinamide formyltransferase 1